MWGRGMHMLTCLEVIMFKDYVDGPPGGVVLHKAWMAYSKVLTLEPVFRGRAVYVDETSGYEL